jgi:hypothetical protein
VLQVLDTTVPPSTPSSGSAARWAPHRGHPRWAIERIEHTLRDHPAPSTTRPRSPPPGPTTDLPAPGMTPADARRNPQRPLRGRDGAKAPGGLKAANGIMVPSACVSGASRAAARPTGRP